MKSLNSYLELTVSQFKSVYIIWTILTIFFEGFFLYLVSTLLKDFFYSDLKPISFIIQSLLIFLLPINSILFYISLYRDNRRIKIILAWLPILVIFLFSFWSIYMIKYTNELYAVLIILFIISSAIIRIKQDRYFKFLDGKRIEKKGS